MVCCFLTDTSARIRDDDLLMMGFFVYLQCFARKYWLRVPPGRLLQLLLEGKKQLFVHATRKYHPTGEKMSVSQNFGAVMGMVPTLHHISDL